MFHYLRYTVDFHMKFHLTLSHSTRSTFWRQTAKNGVVAAGEIPSNVELADAIVEIQSNYVLSKFNNIKFVILNYTSDDLCRNCWNSVEIWRKNVQVTWPSKRILIGSWPFSSKFHTLLQLPATWMVTHNVHHSSQVRTCWFRMKNIKFCREKTATWSSHVTRFTTNENFPPISVVIHLQTDTTVQLVKRSNHQTHDTECRSSTKHEKTLTKPRLSWSTNTCRSADLIRPLPLANFRFTPKSTNFTSKRNQFPRNTILWRFKHKFAYVMNRPRGKPAANWPSAEHVTWRTNQNSRHLFGRKISTWFVRFECGWLVRLISNDETGLSLTKPSQVNEKLATLHAPEWK